MDIAESIVRWLLWILVHLILKVTDYVYKIISLFFGYGTFIGSLLPDWEYL